MINGSWLMGENISVAKAAEIKGDPVRQKGETCRGEFHAVFAYENLNQCIADLMKIEHVACGVL